MDRSSAESLDGVLVAKVACGGVGGLGLVAARDFAPGELVLSERPFLVVPARTVLHTPIAYCYTEADEVIQALTKRIEVAVHALPTAAREWFYALSDKYMAEEEGAMRQQEPSIRGIVETNGLPMGDRSETGCIPSCAGVYRLACRINHSCRPNVHHQWNDRKKAETIFAIRSISKGEEVVTSYFQTAGLTRQERQELQLSKWKFGCRCSKCELLGPALAASDAREARIAHLDEAISSLASLDPAKALRLAANRIQLLKQDVADPVELARTAFDAFQICMQTPSRLHQAQSWICLCYRLSLRARGWDSPQSERIRALVHKPWTLRLGGKQYFEEDKQATVNDEEDTKGAQKLREELKAVLDGSWWLERTKLSGRGDNTSTKTQPPRCVLRNTMSWGVL